MRVTFIQACCCCAPHTNTHRKESRLPFGRKAAEGPYHSCPTRSAEREPVLGGCATFKVPPPMSPLPVVGGAECSPPTGIVPPGAKIGHLAEAAAAAAGFAHVHLAFLFRSHPRESHSNGPGCSSLRKRKVFRYTALPMEGRGGFVFIMSVTC